MVRFDGSEAMHFLAGFETIDSCPHMWKFLGKCKALVRLPTVLMVKVVLFPRTDACPSFGALTRYPCFPRRGVHGRDGFRPQGCLKNVQLYVKFSGTDLGELLLAVKRALSWSLSLLGRAPDYLSQRLGRSAGWPHALDYIYVVLVDVVLLSGITICRRLLSSYLDCDMVFVVSQAHMCIFRAMSPSIYTL